MVAISLKAKRGCKCDDIGTFGLYALINLTKWFFLRLLFLHVETLVNDGSLKGLLSREGVAWPCKGE